MEDSRNLPPLLHYSSEHVSSITSLLTASGSSSSLLVSSSLDGTCKVTKLYASLFILLILFLLTTMFILYQVGLGLCHRKAYSNSSLSSRSNCKCASPRRGDFVLWVCRRKNFCQQAWYWAIGGLFLCCRRPSSCVKRTQVVYGAWVSSYSLETWISSVTGINYWKT